MNDPRPVLVALILLPALAGLLAGPAAARAGAREAPELLSGRGELRVADAAGEVLRAPLAEGVEIHALTPLDGDAWLAAGTRDSSTLIVVRGEGGEARRVPAPEAGGALVASPAPLASGGELLGLAWLAGADPRSLEVRFAPWTGGGLPGDGEGISEWAAPETVAGPAPGSQTALTGTVLRDGSVLLLWSAHDGEDDEILWSLRSGGAWSEPARLAADNAVPDILPAVAPLGGGAVAAWNRYDGREYRVVVSRWAGGVWSAPEPAGPPGSLYPVLYPVLGRSSGKGADGVELRYRDARRRAWMALRLDGSGRIVDPAPVPVTSPDR